jgi:tRNA pseudouridine32 synthase/23S rRNA pseudouridine746 synthase/23S rRNA pseudouridine1911/1915/1917 synthase
LREESGTITAPIGRDPKHPTRRKVIATGSPSVTHYRVISQNERAALVRVRLETGRTHQIRVHFAHLEAPLLGDALYEGDVSFLHRQALHSAHLSLTHPLTGENLQFTSPLPADLEMALEQVKLK